MAALKSFAQDSAFIDPHFQTFCASHGLFTLEDFLLHDIDALSAIAETQPHPEKKRLTQGIAEVLSILERKRQPWMNGSKLLEDALQNKHVLSTGCQGIDVLLGGGLREGQLTELVGPSSSGKTQICLQAASSVAQNHPGCVMYLDTSCSFSPQRIACFVDSAKQNCLQNVMNNILCHSVFDIFAMFDVLHKLELSLRSQLSKKGGHRLHLLIIDSISSLIAPILGGGGPQGHALMVSAGILLKKLAHEHNLAVFVINHTVGGEGGVPKPALGDTWKSIPHTRLLHLRDRGSNRCTISIIKHPSMAVEKSLSFVLRG